MSTIAFFGIAGPTKTGGGPGLGGLAWKMFSNDVSSCSEHVHAF